MVPDPYLESRPTSDSNPSKLDDQLEAQLKNAANIAVFEDKEIPQSRVSLCTPVEGIGEGSYSAALGRSFSIISHGYMGLAPPDAQSGDQVVLLLGTRFPFILRKTGNAKNTFKLHGESFMETVIDTEVAETRCRDLSVEEIAIV